MMLLHNGRAALVGVEDVDRAFLDQYPRLEVIGSNTTGIDHLDLKLCESRGIKVFTLRGETEFLETITSTAEHTFGLIIALARGYKKALNDPFHERKSYTGYKLAGKILGIIGYGRIGKQVSEIAKVFGMDVACIDKGNLEDIDFILERSDFVSLHIPLEGNEWFFKTRMFFKMKDTAYFINTSRSDIVERGALLFALNNGIIKGAAVDFIDDKDLVEFSKTSNNSLILTNHQGGNTIEDQILTERFILDKINNYLKK